MTGGSIQAARLAETQHPGYVRATKGAVRTYAENATDEAIQCRLGNHSFLPPNRKHLGITGYDERAGLWLVRKVCRSCGCAVRTEWWEARPVKGGIEWVFIGNTLTYQLGPNGEEYRAPAGEGQIARRDLLEAVAGLAMQGVDLAALRKALREQED